jgi:aspartyl-tRNA(Asn)/glutamyl-tRNA(Gln) amidotransferase subunit A
MARGVGDVALLLDVIAAPDARDWSALPRRGTGFMAELDESIEGVRIAVSTTLGYVDVDPQVSDVIDELSHLLESVGAEVVRKDPGFTDPIETLNVLWYSRAAAAVQDLGAEAREVLDPGLIEVSDEGLRLAGQELIAADRRRAELGEVMSRFHTGYDLLMTPTLPIVAFEAGQEVPSGWPYRRWTSWTPFTYPFNLTQQPAITVPAGSTKTGLPIGVQFVGRRFEDGLVLRAAYAVDQLLRDVAHRPPSMRDG